MTGGAWSGRRSSRRGSEEEPVDGDTWKRPTVKAGFFTVGREKENVSGKRHKNKTWNHLFFYLSAERKVGGVATDLPERSDRTVLRGMSSTGLS